MTFKQFYIISERKYFSSLSSITSNVIDLLQKKIASRKTIRSGTVYTVPFGQTADIEIVFYKGYSQKALEYKRRHSEDIEFDSLYFQETKESNGRIEIYINTTKKSQRYYKGKTFEEIINKSLPVYVKSILTHEIAHAYDDVITGTLQFKPDPSTEDEYYNADEEINANLNQFFKYIVDNKDFKHFVQIGNVNASARFALSILAKEPWVAPLTKENKKKIIRSVYTHVTNLVDSAKE